MKTRIPRMFGLVLLLVGLGGTWLFANVIINEDFYNIVSAFIFYCRVILAMTIPLGVVVMIGI